MLGGVLIDPLVNMEGLGDAGAEFLLLLFLISPDIADTGSGSAICI